MDKRIQLSDLAEQLAVRESLPLNEAERFVRSFFDLTEEALLEDRFVKISGFGTMKLVEVSDRESVNINTGERFLITGHSKVSFTPDPVLRDLVNRPFAHFTTVTLNDLTTDEEIESITAPVPEPLATPSPAEELPSPTFETVIPEAGNSTATSLLETPVPEPTSTPQSTPVAEQLSTTAVDVPVIELPTPEDPPPMPVVEKPAPEPTHPQPSVSAIEEAMPTPTVVKRSPPRSAASDPTPQYGSAIKTPQPAPSPESTMAMSETPAASSAAPENPGCTADLDLTATTRHDAEEQAAAILPPFGIPTTKVKGTITLHSDTSEKSERHLNGWMIACFILITLFLMVLSFLAGRHNWLSLDSTSHDAAHTPAQPARPSSTSASKPAPSSTVRNAPNAAQTPHTTATAARAAQERLAREKAQAEADAAKARAEQEKAKAQAETAKAKLAEVQARTAAEQQAKAHTKLQNPQQEKAEKFQQMPNGSFLIVGTRAVHTLRKGENLYLIAERTYGNKSFARYIILHNSIQNPDLVPAGKKIKLPKLVKKS